MLRSPSHVLPLTLLIGLLVGCEGRPEPPPMPERHAAPEPALVHEAAPEPVATPEASFAGDGPIEFAPVEVLHEREGLRLEAQRYRFEGLTGRAFRVRLPRRPDLRIVASDEVVDFDELLPNDRGPWAAINGGFYAAATPGEPYEAMGLVMSGGDEHHELTRNGGSGVLVVTGDAAPVIVHRSDLDGSPREALQSIDRIVAGGENLVKPRDDARSAARSAVVVGEDHLWLVALTADGSLIPLRGADGYGLKSTGWQGLPLWAFAQYLLETTDARDALNLDGAVSTQLAVRDGEYRFELRGERGTINAIVVRPR